jgi:predicted DNA binding protein
MKRSEPDTELLRTALKRGYFKIPRQTSLVDIADEHDISDGEAMECLHTEIDSILRDHFDGIDAADAAEQD